MKKTTSIIMAVMLVVSLSACSAKEEKKVIINEPEETEETVITVNNVDQEMQEPEISVEKIEQLGERVVISEWMDEENAIVSKENTTLGKMTSEEFEGAYPRSLYYYNTSTKEYTPIKEQENVLLGGGTLSSDKKFLLYSEYVLGDPSYFIMNLDTKDSFCICNDKIGGARSAIWVGNEVVGSAYNGGIYMASTAGEISILEGLEGESIFILRATKDYIYYTGDNTSLMKMNRVTREKTSLNIENVFDVVLSADGAKMLILQSDNTKSALLLVDLEDGKQTTIAEGTDISSISWSPDQRRIAYAIKFDGTNATMNGLYAYDMLSAKPTQIAPEIQDAFTSWSPLGDKLMYSEWNGEEYESSIIYLNQ